MDKRTRCAFCGEEILAIAVKCKHCHSDLSVTPAAARAARDAWKLGGAILLCGVVALGAGAIGCFGWYLLSQPSWAAGTADSLAETCLCYFATSAAAVVAIFGMKKLRKWGTTVAFCVGGSVIGPMGCQGLREGWTWLSTLSIIAGVGLMVLATLAEGVIRRLAAERLAAQVKRDADSIEPAE